MKRIIFISVLAILFALIPQRLAAQTSRPMGRIEGVAFDHQGAVVASVKVVIEGNGIQKTVATDEEGKFFIELPPGLYRLRTESPTFLSYQKDDINVGADRTLSFEISLVVNPLLDYTPHDYFSDNERIEPIKTKIDYTFEAFSFKNFRSETLELMIQYSTKSVEGEFIEYNLVMLACDSFSVIAGKVRLNRKTFTMEAEGNVVIKFKGREYRGKRARLDLRREKIIVELTD